MSILVWRDHSSGTRTNDEVTAKHKHEYQDKSRNKNHFL